MEIQKNGAVANAQSNLGASIGRNVELSEEAHAKGVYTFQIISPYEHLRAHYIKLREHVEAKKSRLRKGRLSQLVESAKIGFKNPWEAIEEIEKRMADMVYVREEGVFENLVTTVGKNDALDKYLAGSTYTAAWYLGLVDGGSTPTYAAADTMASHAGWTENQNYSQAARPTAAWSAASAGAKALSSALSFSINAATQTIAGAFLTSVSTKGGTTGILYSVGAFSGGNKSVTTGDTLSVSYSASL